MCTWNICSPTVKGKSSPASGLGHLGSHQLDNQVYLLLFFSASVITAQLGQGLVSCTCQGLYAGTDFDPLTKEKVTLYNILALWIKSWNGNCFLNAHMLDFGYLDIARTSFVVLWRSINLRILDYTMLPKEFLICQQNKQSSKYLQNCGF